MKKEVLLVILVVVFSISLVFASVTCNPSSVFVEYEQGEFISDTIYCSNNDPNGSVDITKSGDFEIDNAIIGKSSSKTINISFNPASGLGINSGKIQFNMTDDVPIIFYVTEAQNQPTTSISFPTSKVMNVQQGNEYQKKVTMIIPSSYPNPINIQTIEFSEENNIVSFGDIETGILNQGDIKDIPIKINAKEAQVGEYPGIAVQIRYDDGGTIKTISCTLYIIVTASLNPTTNVTFSNPPSCSLSASVMNVNNTYSFTCSNVQKNLEISPLYNEYFEGLNAHLSGSIYTYEFKPIKYGDTYFLSTFTYLGAPLFSPFKQEIKISSAGSVVPGTDLKLLFTPSLNKASDGEEVIIQLVDNKTNSLVDNPEIYIEAVTINKLNNSNSFPFKFYVGKNYEIRGKAPGYDDLVQIVNITESPLTLTISPSQDYYYVNDKINITSNQNDTKILINNNIESSPYTFTTAGNYTIKLVKEGFTSVNKTIIVKNSVSFDWDSCSTDYEKWKKGKKITCGLKPSGTNYSWETYLNSSLISSGNGDIVEFELDDYGQLEIRVDEINIASYNVEKKGIINWLRFWEWEYSWVGWVIVSLICVTLIYLLFLRKGKEDEAKLSFVGQPQGE